MSDRKTLLHVGCGLAPQPDLFPADQWSEVRLDIDPAVKPDLVGSMTDMQTVGNETMDGLYCSHSLEHLHAHEVEMALAEFHRVLAPGGVLAIDLPDLQEVATAISRGSLEETIYVSPAGPVAPLDMVYGLRSAVQSGNHHFCHKTGFTRETLGRKLSAARFNNIRVTKGTNYDLHATANRTSLNGRPTLTVGHPDEPSPAPTTRQKAIIQGTVSRGVVSMWWSRAAGGVAWPFNRTKAVLYVEDDVGNEIAEARNKLVAESLARESDTMEIEGIFWVDDDVILVSSLALRALDSHHVPICSGVYFSKEEYPQPLVFPAVGQGVDQFVPDKAYEVWGHGMGLTLVRMEVYRRMRDELDIGIDKYGNPQWYKTPGKEDADRPPAIRDGIMDMGGTEDLYFCSQAAKLGYKPVIDTGRHAFGFHMDMKTRRCYPPKQWEQYRKNQPIVWPTPDGDVIWR